MDGHDDKVWDKNNNKYRENREDMIYGTSNDGKVLVNLDYLNGRFCGCLFLLLGYLMYTSRF